MDFYSRQLKALQAVPSKHQPTHRRATEMRRSLRQEGLEQLVGAERLARRKMLAKAVGDPFLNERIIGTMDLLPVNFLERGAVVARSVCRIELKDALGRLDGCATGIAVGEDLLLTNHHVFPSKEHARRSMAQFNYADDARGEPMPSRIFKFDPDRFFCTDEHLDYTLVAVCPTSLDGSALAELGVSTLVRDAGKTILSEHLNVVQHPGGQNKQVAIRHNELSEETDDFLLYVADTDRGSSGSAVYNDAWVVVALHCAGVAKVDDHGRYIDKRSGKPMSGKPASINDVQCEANRGVRISRIYDHVRTRLDLKDEERRLGLSVFKTMEEFTTDPFRGAPARAPGLTTAASPVAAAVPGAPASPPPIAARPAPTPPPNAGPAAIAVERLGADSYADRTGYDPMFLGVPVPLPRLSATMLADVAPVRGRRDGVLDYTHFSVVMSRSRKVAFFTACNVDGRQSRKLPRPAREAWYIDGRIDEAHQTSDPVYVRNRLDRGHLVRREDPVWGEEAARANLDTFHFTNCSPQHEQLNQKTWLDLENHILVNLRNKQISGSVLTGPVFAPDDLEYRGVQIPEQFWKVVVTNDGGQLAAAAYVESQRDLLSELEFSFGTYKTYRVTVARIEELTGLDFGPLRDADTATAHEDQGMQEKASTHGAREVIDVSREIF
jgi:endonuclease G